MTNKEKMLTLLGELYLWGFKTLEELEARPPIGMDAQDVRDVVQYCLNTGKMRMRIDSKLYLPQTLVDSIDKEVEAL